MKYRYSMRTAALIHDPQLQGGLAASFYTPVGYSNIQVFQKWFAEITILASLLSRLLCYQISLFQRRLPNFGTHLSDSTACGDCSATSTYAELLDSTTHLP